MGIIPLTLIHLVGDVGSGKTLFATHLAKNDSRPVYANYKIKIKRHHELKPEMLSHLNESSLVIMDEAYRWLESRLSSRNLNLYLSYILFQSRKRGLDIVLTDQLEGTIDTRFRQMTNYEIQCQAIEVGFHYTIFKLSRFQVYQPISMIMPFETAEKLYPLFDSWEFLPINEDLVFNVTEDKKTLMQDIDKIVAGLLKKADAKVYTKGIIADICLRNEYPKSYIDLIYNSIQASKIGISRNK